MQKNSFYIFTILSAVIVFGIEHKRIKKMSFLRKLLITLAWPFFLLIQFIMDFQAFFSLDAKWDPIPHNDPTSFEHVNQDNQNDSYEDEEDEGVQMEKDISSAG